MADWTTLSNQAVGVGGLPSGTTVTALRDNPIAIAEGATGAPLISGALTKIIAGEEIGAFVFATGPSGTEYGNIVAGSSLNYAGVLSSISGDAGVSSGRNLAVHSFSYSSGQGASLSGSWMCLGEVNNSASLDQVDGTATPMFSIIGATMWQRVA